MEHEKIKEMLGNDGYANFIKYFAEKHRKEKGGDGSQEYLASLKNYLERKIEGLCELMEEGSKDKPLDISLTE